MNLEKNATGRVRWHGLMAILAVIAVVSMAVVAVGLDESDGSTYGSEPEPYGYVNIIPSEVSDNSTFYIVKGGTLWIGFDLDESDFIESELIGAGLSFDAEKGEATGTITNSCTLNVDGKRLNIVAVSPAYGTDVSNYPTYQASYREDYELDMVRHVGDSVNERFEITFKNNYDYTISTDQEYEFNQAGISFDVDSESNGWTSTYYLTVTGTVREIMSFDYRVSLIQMDVESHYIHYVYLTGHVEFYYTITFHPDGGTLQSVNGQPIPDRYYSLDQSIELPDLIASEGRQFDGWYTDLSGGAFVGDAGDHPFDIYTPNGDLDLYPHYSELVNPVVDITISGSSNIGVGEQTTLRAESKLLHNDEEGNRRVVWDIISGEQYVRIGVPVDTETGGTITVTGQAVGTAVIRAMADAGVSGDQRVQDTFTISVTESSSVEMNSFTLIYDPVNDNVTGMPPSFSDRSTEPYYVTQVAAMEPKSDGYTFLGWSYYSSTPHVDLQPGDQISLPPGTTYLYAVWEKIETMWTLSFDPNGGTGGPPQISEYETGQSHIFRVPGAQYNPDPPDASKEFGGWSEKPNSSIVAVYPGGTFYTTTQNTILYAIWNDVSEQNVFILHYDANRGTGAPSDSQPEYSNENTKILTISPNTPTRPGYTFMGWSLNPYWNEGDDYYPSNGSILVYPGTTTLYAIWSQTNFTITFNANNGTGGPDVVVASGSGAAQVMIPTGPDPTRDGYTFLGWSTDPNGPVDSNYAKGKIVTIDQNIILYAVWSKDSQSGGDDEEPEEIDYEFHFIVGEGVENAPEDVTVKGDENGVNFQIPDNILKLEGLTFLGWSNVENSDSAAWFAGKTYSFTYRVNYFYPVWEKGVDTWSLSFHPNGGIGAPPTQYATVEDETHEFTIPAEPRPTKSGCTFLGWDEDPDVNRPSIPVTDSDRPYTATKQDTILYAIWAEGNEDSFTLSFDANGGSDAPASISGQDVGSHRFTIPLQYPNMDGQIFAGWSDSPTGGIVAYVGGTYVASSQDVTLYAVWVADDGTSKNFTVFYQPFEGADPVTKPVASNGNSAVHTLMTEDDEDFVSRVGYKFVGWSETEGGKVIEGGSYSTEAMNVVLYAVWSSTSATFPEATFEYTVDGLTVSFDASMAPNALTWYWDLGDGTKVGLKSFEHTFPGAGTYLVSLTVTNGGQQDVKRVYITVEDSGPSIWIYVAIIAIVAIMAVAVLHYKGVI